MAVICTKCGYEIKNEKAKFCPICGKVLEKENNNSDKENKDQESIDVEEFEEAVDMAFKQLYAQAEKFKNYYRVMDEKELDNALQYLAQVEIMIKNVDTILSTNHELLSRNKVGRLEELKERCKRLLNKQKIEVFKYTVCQKEHRFQYYFNRKEKLSFAFIPQTAVSESGWNQIIGAKKILIEEAKKLELDLNSDEMLKSTMKEMDNIISIAKIFHESSQKEENSNTISSEDNNIKNNQVSKENNIEEKCSNNSVIKNEERVKIYNVVEDSKEKNNVSHQIKQKEVTNKSTENKKEELDEGHKVAGIAILITFVIYFFDFVHINGGALKKIVIYIITYIIVYILLETFLGKEKR